MRSRLIKLVRAAAILLALVALLFVSLFRPVDEAELERTEFYRESLLRLDAALEARPPVIPVEFLAGAARMEIAPPLEWGIRLAGNRSLLLNRARDIREESVHVRVLALHDGENSLVILTADVLVFSPELRERTLELIREEIPLRSRDFLAVATHTHNGPGHYWAGGVAERVVGAYQPRVFEFLTETFARCTIRAFSNLRPARVLTDSVDVEEPVAYRKGEGIKNPELRLIRFQGELDPFRIDLINYAAHPTALIRHNHALSGDYPGILAMNLETDERTVLFLPGTIGDQKPRHLRDEPVPSAQAIARILVDSGLDRMQPQMLAPTPTIEAYEIEVRLPPVQLRVFSFGPFASLRLRDAVTERIPLPELRSTRIHIVRLGSLLLLGAPCDFSASLGLPILEYARELGFQPVILSMTGDWIGYVLTEDDYHKGLLKVRSQLHGPLSGPLFESLFRRAIERLAAANPPVRHPDRPVVSVNGVE